MEIPSKVHCKVYLCESGLDIKAIRTV